MEKSALEVGDVVQISPEAKDCFFKGCFMVVSEPKEWGAQGYICMPTTRDENTGFAYFRASFAYFRASWDIMEFIGRAEWVAEMQEEVHDS